jgi:hypothetical protein
MKAKGLLTALLSIVIAGCSLRAKPAKTAVTPAVPKPVVAPAPPAAPPAPLSIPQTNVELPSPQPVNPAALVTEAPQPVEAPPAAPPRTRRTGPPASQTVSPALPAANPAVEPPRPAVQEIVPQAETKRLQEQAQGRRREVKQILDQLSRRQLSDPQKDVAATIRSFVTLSEEAEQHNDPRQAVALAERAWILAKELQSEK